MQYFYVAKVTSGESDVCVGHIAGCSEWRNFVKGSSLNWHSLHRREHCCCPLWNGMKLVFHPSIHLNILPFNALYTTSPDLLWASNIVTDGFTLELVSHSNYLVCHMRHWEYDKMSAFDNLGMRNSLKIDRICKEIDKRRGEMGGLMRAEEVEMEMEMESAWL